jgi:hypothetical protein
MMRYDAPREDLSLNLVASLDRHQGAMCMGEAYGH